MQLLKASSRDVSYSVVANEKDMRDCSETISDGSAMLCDLESKTVPFVGHKIDDDDLIGELSRVFGCILSFIKSNVDQATQQHASCAQALRLLIPESGPEIRAESHMNLLTSAVSANRVCSYLTEKVFVADAVDVSKAVEYINDIKEFGLKLAEMCSARDGMRSTSDSAEDFRSDVVRIADMVIKEGSTIFKLAGNSVTDYYEDDLNTKCNALADIAGGLSGRGRWLLIENWDANMNNWTELLEHAQNTILKEVKVAGTRTLINAVKKAPCQHL